MLVANLKIIVTCAFFSILIVAALLTLFEWGREIDRKREAMKRRWRNGK